MNALLLRRSLPLWMLLAGLTPAMPQAARACGVLGPPGTSTDVTDEAAVIAWDARTHTERFVRGVSFRSSADNFGFLVPTPTQPRLAPSGDEIFERLAQTGQPRKIVEPTHGLKLASLLWPAAFAPRRVYTAGSVPAPREVLSAQRVGAYRAVTLRADDPAALGAWLRGRGYPLTPGFSAWVRPYAQRHWVITAFQVVKDKAGNPQAALSPVSLSFHTDRPFFPYSEPASQRAPGAHSPTRRLRLYVLSDVRVDGVLDTPAVRWPGRVQWARPQPSAPVTPPWLTVFDDRSSPRPGVADLYFRPAAAQTPVLPAAVDWPVDKRLGIPVEFVVAALAALRWRTVRVRRRRPAAVGA